MAPLFAAKKKKHEPQEYHDRLEREIDIIKTMGFPGYFLVVWDFIKYAKDNGIPVGPGRGSAAGSLVAYSMGITDVDPLDYDLLFERFLNPERISMPDIDIDFCMNRRGEVIEYVRQQVRRGERRADHHLRNDGREVGRARRRPRARACRTASSTRWPRPFRPVRTSRCRWRRRTRRS